MSEIRELHEAGGVAKKDKCFFSFFAFLPAGSVLLFCNP